MKRIYTICLIVALMFCMSAGVCLAEDSHGADAQSASMSIESGEEPIPDESVTGDSEEADSPEAEEETVETVESDGAVLSYSQLRLCIIGGIGLIIIVAGVFIKKKH